jgi:hypothetical protein
VTRRVPKDTARAQAENEYVAALRGLRDGLRWRTALNAIAGAAVGGGLLLGIDRLVETLAPTLMQVSAPTSLLASTNASAWSFGIAGIAVAGGAIASRVLRRARS